MRIGGGWTAAAIAFIAVATMAPQPDGDGAVRQVLSTSLPAHPGAWRDVLLNVLLYAPLGFVLRVRGSSLSGLFVTAAAVSLTTELLQLRVPGRDPAAIDVFTNVTGGLLGALCARTPSGARVAGVLLGCERAMGRARSPAPAIASRLFLAWSLGAAASVVATAWLLTPAPPPPYFFVVSGPDLDVSPGRPLRIGSDGTPRRRFQGFIDEVQLYSTARSAEDIARDVAQPAGIDHRGSGLVAGYGFDRHERGVARDDSGHALDARLHATEWIEHGRLGGALAFDGKSSEVVVEETTSLDFREAMTLQAWVFPRSDSPRRSSIISRDGDVYYLSATSELGASVVAGGGRFGGALEAVRVRRPIQPDRWTHLALTYDGQTLRFYVDGVLEAAKARWSPHRPVKMMWSGADLTFGVIPGPDRFRTSLLGDLDANVTIRCGEPASRRAPLFSIVGQGSVAPLTLAAVNTDLEVRVATKATRFGLASPPYRVPGALEDCRPGREVSFRLTGPLQRVEVARAGTPVAGSRLGVGAGWAFLLHSELLPMPLQMGGVVLWMAGLVLPLALWARPTVLTALGAAALAGSVVLARSVWLLPPFTNLEIGAAAAACAAGVVWRRRHVG